MRIVVLILVSLLSLKSFAQETESSQNVSLIDKIHNLHEKVEAEGRLVTQLVEQDLMDLPVGLVKDVGATRQIVVIDEMWFTAEGAYFNAYISLDLPFVAEKLAFAAKEIAISPAGISASVGTKLQLVSEHSLPITSKIDLKLPGDGSNYVAWDCNGFQSVNLKGLFEFDRELIIPDDPKDSTGIVTASFEVNAKDVGGILTTINMPPFQVKGLDGFSFAINNAIIDLSDTSNAESMVFPEVYRKDFAGALYTWQGFYLENATVKLPTELKTKQGRKEISVNHLLIDRFGFSGSLEAINLFSTGDGTLDGWPFSIDSLAIDVVRNRLQAGGMRGKLRIPMFSPESTFDYTAAIFKANEELNYAFSLTSNDSLELPALIAKVTLYPNSTVKISKVNGKFVPEAILHGKAYVANEDVKFKGIEFQDLHISTESPYLHGGYWSLVSDENKVANFPVTINDFSMKIDKGVLALSVDVGLNLMNKSDKGFGGSTGVTITAAIEEEEIDIEGEKVTQTDFVYKGTAIDEILIDASIGIVRIEGSISLFKGDSTYGKGFKGSLEMEVVKGFAIDATAQFGNVNGLRYWYVDAGARLPVGAGAPVAFYGFAGGLYYHMMMDRFDEEALRAAAKGNANEPSSSGITYIPTGDIFLGFKAGVTIGSAGKPEAFNADATFEIAFNSTGGVKYIGFGGQAYFMTPIDKRGNDPPLYADLLMTYDFPNKTFFATLDAYVNVAGVLKGRNENNLAGRAVMYFSPQSWYIHIGTPDQRIGLNFIGIVETGAYFMVGDNMPPMPPIPPILQEYFGSDIDLNFMARENELADPSAAGFAFGADFQVATGKKKFLIFYGEFNAGLGFDIMLKDMSNVNCVGDSLPIGINGWYASGQAWAYLQGAVGIKVKLFMVKKEFEIASIGAGVVLQAKLPKPSYFQGAVKGHFNILGGLVKGKFKFKVQIGEGCELETQGAPNIQVIADVTPGDNATEVDVFNAPQVAFNIKVNEEFQLMDINDNVKVYRVKLDHFTVKSAGIDLPGKLNWNIAKDVLVYNSNITLPQQEEIEASVKVLWEERIDNQWQPLGGDDQAFEDRVHVFKTGEGPRNIPEDNIDFMYPVQNMQNFYKNQHHQGYLSMHKYQAYLFDKLDEAGTEWDFIARFENTDYGDQIDVDIEPDSENNGLLFNIPPNLSNDKIYDLFLLKLPVNVASFDKNVTEKESEILQVDSLDIDVVASEKEVTGSLSLPEDFRIYQTQFRVSKYNTINEKIDMASNHITTARFNETTKTKALGYAFNSDELFDSYELQNLIKLRAIPENSWFDNFLSKLYRNSGDIKWRKIGAVGAPPIRAIYVNQYNYFSDYPELFESYGKFNATYDLEYYAQEDYFDIRNAFVNRYIDENNKTPNLAIHFYDFQNFHRNTEYKINLFYTLPGQKDANSFKTLIMKN
jgi:hypothetical protein